MSLLHYSLMVLALAVAIAAAGNIDDEPVPPSAAARLCESAAAVLMSPGRQIWQVVQPPGRHLPDLLEHLAFVGNSALWGAAFAGIVAFFGRRPDHHRPSRAA